MGKQLILKSTAPATVLRLPISSIKGNGMTPNWKIYLKAPLYSSSISKPGSLESLCSALWMIPSLPRQSLRHGLCTRLKQDYGHQAVAVMLSCNGIVLNYAIIMYDKSKSKVKIVQEIADELPIPPVASYFLCDSWYTCGDIMDAFIKKGFYTIGALRTNRILYPCGIKQKVSEFALHLRKTDAGVSLVTVGSRSYYVYRYEGSLNGIENAVVLISYPKDAFHVPKTLRAFISTDVSLSTREILDKYVERWPIEVFFRQSKDKLSFDRYQIRSSEGIRRYWLLMSLAHLLAAVKPCLSKTAMHIFIAIFRKSGCASSTSVGQDTFFLRIFWLWWHKSIVQFSKFALL